MSQVASSPKLFRTCRPISGESAKPIAGALPKAPMYAPRMSAGARSATTACDVGTQSISPITKTTTTDHHRDDALRPREERERQPHHEQGGDELRRGRDAGRPAASAGAGRA